MDYWTGLLRTRRVQATVIIHKLTIPFTFYDEGPDQKA